MYSYYNLIFTDMHSSILLHATLPFVLYVYSDKLQSLALKRIFFLTNRERFKVAVRQT